MPQRLSPICRKGPVRRPMGRDRETAGRRLPDEHKPSTSGFDVEWMKHAKARLASMPEGRQRKSSIANKKRTRAETTPRQGQLSATSDACYLSGIRISAANRSSLVRCRPEPRGGSWSTRYPHATSQDRVPRSRGSTAEPGTPSPARAGFCVRIVVATAERGG